MKKSIDKSIVWIALGLLVLSFFALNTPIGKQAAAQRESLLSDVSTPQQIANARIAYLVLIPLAAAYLFYMNSKPTNKLQDLWKNLGVKMGLVAGFTSIFVLQHQVAFFLINLIVMGTWGLWLATKREVDAITAILIPFAPAYYYSLVQITSTTNLELASFFDAATIAAFIWVIPIFSSLVIYALYRKYIPLLTTEVMK